MDKNNLDKLGGTCGIESYFSHIKNMHYMFNEIEQLLCDIHYKGYIAGGYPRYIMSDRTPTDTYEDIDLYVYDKDDFKEVYDILVSKYPILKTTLGTTIFKYNNELLQLVHPDSYYHETTYGHPMSVLFNYDFTVSMIAYLGEGEVIHYKWWPKHMREKSIIIWNTSNPVVTSNRILKYQARGLTISKQHIDRFLRMWDSFNWDEYFEKHKERFLKSVKK